jgi:hypothetical protein
MNLDSVPLPGLGDTSWHDWATALDKDVRSMRGGFYLDSYSGSDDAKLTAAIADQQASGGSLNYAPIILPPRPITFSTPRTLYSGLNIVGVSGARLPELAGGNYEGPEITLGSGITSGTNSWWNGTGEIYGVTMRDFSVQGSQSSTTSVQHQFMDIVSGTLYMSKFDNLGFNFMRGVFGRKDRQLGFTGVCIGGVWTMNNLWDTQMNVGGSDSSLWMGGLLNLGTSQSALQTGTYADNDYMLMFSNLSKTTIGHIFLTALNGWRGMRLQGTDNSLAFHGGVYEGFKPSRVNGLLGGPAPGTVVRIDHGSASFFGTHFGQFMDNPDAAELGGVQVNGGEASFHGCKWYGLNMDTENAIHHTGGRVYVDAAQWLFQTRTGRPRVKTSATAGSGDTSFYCPDQSVTVVA